MKKKEEEEEEEKEKKKGWWLIVGPIIILYENSHCVQMYFSHLERNQLIQFHLLKVSTESIVTRMLLLLIKD